jgi:hypothetical protein
VADRQTTCHCPHPNKWVFAKKYNKSRELIKYKVQLIAKGCSQRPGQDYNETFALVVHLETIRTILTLVQEKNMIVQQMDIKGAYLNGTLQEEVYMHQSDGYGDGTDCVCCLIKTLYGLKQAGCEWNREFNKCLKTLRFHPLTSDPCTYMRETQGNLEILTVWVNNILLFACIQKGMDNMKADLTSIVDLTDIGEPLKIIGIEITWKPNSIAIMQTNYIELILKQEGMENCHPVKMPLDPNIVIARNPLGKDGDHQNAFTSLIGSLQYLSTAMWPDIFYAINWLSAYTTNPSLAHQSATKRILHYLAGTKTKGIIYQAECMDLQGNNPFYGYTDVAYTNLEDYHSTSGYVFITNVGAITWGSCKQTIITLSSIEVEYIILFKAAHKAKWLAALYDELGYQVNGLIKIFSNNNGSIAMAMNPQFHKQSKHITIRYHWIRQQIQDGLLQIHLCQDPQQTVDILTKALPPEKHN